MNLPKLNQFLNELYSIKRDAPIWDEETSQLLSIAIFQVESLEESLINKMFELQERLQREIIRQQIHLVFAKCKSEQQEIRVNLDEAIQQLNALEKSHKLLHL